MSRHCYDTSILIGLLRGDTTVLELIHSHEQAEDVLATTAISAFELGLGCTSVRERMEVAELLETLEGLSLDMNTAFIAGQEQLERIKDGETAALRDLLIGIIAREAGWILHTLDKAFPQIEGLELVQH